MLNFSSIWLADADDDFEDEFDTLSLELKKLELESMMI